MQAFAYASPKSATDVVRLLAQGRGEAAVLAGGTDLLSLMKDGVVAPRTLVSIKAVPEWHGIEERGGALRIGATTTLEELRGHPAAARLSALQHAINGILSPQIRAMGTVGGDLCQRPRCWYFRAGFGLLPQAGGRSMVEQGDHRYHAIFGGGPARFVNASSLAPALLVHDAHLEVEGSSGRRELPVAELWTSPRSAGERELALAADEVVTTVVVPLGALHSATYEVRDRQTLDWPLAAAAVALELDGDTVTAARCALGHVAPVPWPAAAAAAALVGQRIDPARAERAAQAAVADAAPLPGNRYKVRLARVAMQRAILRAAGREV